MRSKPDALVSGRLSELLRQLSEAEHKYARASKAIKSAERKEELAGYAVSALREEIAMEKLRLRLDFEDFIEQVEDTLVFDLAWTDIELENFINPRMMDLVQAYQEGKDAQDTADLLQTLPPRPQNW